MLEWHVVIVQMYRACVQWPVLKRDRNKGLLDNVDRSADALDVLHGWAANCLYLVVDLQPDAQSNIV